MLLLTPEGLVRLDWCLCCVQPIVAPVCADPWRFDRAAVVAGLPVAPGKGCTHGPDLS
jgi:hypothetical protein